MPDRIRTSAIALPQSLTLADVLTIAGVWPSATCDECWLELPDPDGPCPRCDDPGQAVPPQFVRRRLRAAGHACRRGDRPGFWLLVPAGHCGPVHVYYHPDPSRQASSRIAAYRRTLLARGLAVRRHIGDDGAPYLRVRRLPPVLGGGR